MAQPTDPEPIGGRIIDQDLVTPGARRADGTIRLATGNVWWRFGDRRRRQAAIVQTLDQLRADVALAETSLHG